MEFKKELILDILKTKYLKYKSFEIYPASWTINITDAMSYDAFRIKARSVNNTGGKIIFFGDLIINVNVSALVHKSSIEVSDGLEKGVASFSAENTYGSIGALEVRSVRQNFVRDFSNIDFELIVVQQSVGLVQSVTFSGYRVIML